MAGMGGRAGSTHAPPGFRDAMQLTLLALYPALEACVLTDLLVAGDTSFDAPGVAVSFASLATAHFVGSESEHADVL